MSESRMVEIARWEIAAGWDHDRAQAAVPPGSLEEAAALDAIDAARDEELDDLEDTQATRARRHASYWQRRSA